MQNRIVEELRTGEKLTLLEASKRILAYARKGYFINKVANGVSIWDRKKEINFFYCSEKSI